RRHQQILTPTLTAATRESAWRIGVRRTRRAGRLPWPTARVALLLGAAFLAGCDNLPRLVPEAGMMGVARLEPRNSSTVRGIISFTQRGSKVWISASFTDLFPGSHSIYIHEVGNCSSANAASAGPVWNVARSAEAGKRTG